MPPVFDSPRMPGQQTHILIGLEGIQGSVDIFKERTGESIQSLWPVQLDHSNFAIRGDLDV